MLLLAVFNENPISAFIRFEPILIPKISKIIRIGELSLVVCVKVPRAVKFWELS